MAGLDHSGTVPDAQPSQRFLPLVRASLTGALGENRPNTDSPPGSIMEPATQLWEWWLSLLSGFAAIFTRPGWVRFVQ
jgi:hypothetical protein